MNPTFLVIQLPSLQLWSAILLKVVCFKNTQHCLAWHKAGYGSFLRSITMRLMPSFAKVCVSLANIAVTGVLPVLVGYYQPSSFIPTEQKKCSGQQLCLHTAKERLSSGYGIFLFAVLVHLFIYFVGLPEHWLSLESPDHQERDRGCCNAATVTSERVCRTNIKRIRNAIATRASAFFVVALLVFPVAARGPFLRRRRLIYDSSCEFLLGCLPPSRPACLIHALLVQTRRRSWILTRPFHP